MFLRNLFKSKDLRISGLWLPYNKHFCKKWFRFRLGTYNFSSGEIRNSLLKYELPVTSGNLYLKLTCFSLAHTFLWAHQLHAQMKDESMRFDKLWLALCISWVSLSWGFTVYFINDKMITLQSDEKESKVKYSESFHFQREGSNFSKFIQRNGLKGYLMGHARGFRLIIILPHNLFRTKY